MVPQADQGDENDFFNPADFESIELNIRFKNLTTEKTIPATHKVSVIEVGDQSLTLSLPSKCCAVDNHSFIEIYRKDNEILRSTAKVKVISETDPDTWAVTVELIQFDKKSWSEFVSLFSERQEEIAQFFERGRR